MKTKATAKVKATVKKGVHQHEAKMHKGHPKTKLRLGKSSRTE